MSEQQVTYSFIVRDVSVTMDEKSIKDDLMKRYVGVEEVTRMFYYDKNGTPNPKASIRVDFTTPTDAEKIRQNGTIVIGGICRPAYAIEKPVYQRQRPVRKQYQNGHNTRKPLCEQDILDMFEEQKKTLAEVLDSFDKKLNDVINHGQDKTTQIALSNKA